MWFLVFNLSYCNAGFFWHRKSGGKRLSVAKQADFLFNQFAIPGFIGPNAPNSNTKSHGHCFTAWPFAVILWETVFWASLSHMNLQLQVWQWSPIFISDLLPLNDFRCKPGWSSFDTEFGVINRLNDKWAGHQTVGWNVGNFNLKHLVSSLSCSAGQFPNMAAAKRYVMYCKLV